MNHFSEKYSRQTILKGFGLDAQQKLRNAAVLVIGLGGLGCPVVEYLAAMGVGRIGIADDDIVSLSNLNRQFIYGENQIGRNKAEVVFEIINQKHSDVIIDVYKERWQQRHCLEYFSKYDVILDATDNFATRYMINDGCVLIQKPLVYGAVSEFEGQVAVFNVKNELEYSCNYRDLFPTPPQNDEIKNCSERGVLGVLPGIIGCFQALETIKIITGLGRPLINKLLTYTGLTQESFIIEFDRHPESGDSIPKDLDVFLKMDYALHCGIDLTNEISWQQAKALIDQNNALVIDVREYNELPRLEHIKHISMPLSELESNETFLPVDYTIFVCQSGKRSLHAIKILREKGYLANMFSIKGGIQSIEKIW